MMGSLPDWYWLIFVAYIAVVFIPTYVAFARRHQNRVAITALNILLGWTGIGWVVAFVWSLTANVERAAPLAERIEPHV